MPNPRFIGKTDQEIINLLEERLAAAHKEINSIIQISNLISYLTHNCSQKEKNKAVKNARIFRESIS